MKVPEDDEVDVLDLTHAQELHRFLELLCGQQLLPAQESAQRRLTAYIDPIAKGTFGLRHLNDLLVLLGQNRISEGFYQTFFADTGLSADQLKAGLRKFRMWALLCYGNFRRPFQDWRQMTSDGIVSCWAAFADGRLDLETQLEKKSRTVTFERLKPHETFATGVMSANIVLQDFRAALALCEVLGVVVDTTDAKRAAVDAGLIKPDGEIRPQALSAAQRDAISAFWSSERAREVANEIEKRLADVVQKRRSAIAITDEYLIADKIDIYVATSMREQWEFVETALFMDAVFEQGHPILSHFDYFDPTQSFLPGHVDKGLVEGLMLNRVRATLYMAQESDTLGKDSELASTLAQGKPVIAFIPRIVNTDRANWPLETDESREVEKWATKFDDRPINFFRKRLFLLLGDNILGREEFRKLCAANDVPNISELLDKFLEAVNDFDPLFSLVLDEHKAFKARHSWFREFVRMFVFAEAVNFDKRAFVLRNAHPLGLQIEIATGTANGVLVVRTQPDCERLLEGILLNDLKFRIVDEKWGTTLVESISESRFRVVTKHPVLTASFWNFFSPARAGRRSSRAEHDS